MTLHPRTPLTTAGAFTIFAPSRRSTESLSLSAAQFRMRPQTHADNVPVIPRGYTGMPEIS